MYNVRKMREDDWEQVSCIYRQGMETNLATFESVCPTYQKWDQAHFKFGRLVCTDKNDHVVGWVALSPISSRCCFCGVAEVSIYIANEAKHQGVGTLLLNREFEESEKNGIWTLQSQIMMNNIPSLSLHKKCGFREVGYREKIAKDPKNEWRDMVLMEHRNTIL